MAEVLAFDPHRARTYLHSLKGPRHRFAWRYYQWRRGKGRHPKRPRGLSFEVWEAIRLAVDVGMGKRPSTVAPATFAGWQERPGGKPPIALYKLTASIPGHPERSHVSGQTLVKAGFTLPETPEPNGLIWTGGGGRNPGVPSRPGTIIVNGIVYDIIAETQDAQGELLMIRRPKGTKEYLARRLPDSPLYGAGRGVIIHALSSRSRNPRRTRLEAPSHFDPRSFRTVKRGRARIIVGCPKRHYHSGRCRVGTRAQAIVRGNPIGPGSVRRQHERDEDCAPFIDPDTWTCTVCGVDHSGLCYRCKGRGFHRPGCPNIENPMSAAARKAYPSIAKWQDRIARAYTRTLRRTRSKVKAQAAAEKESMRGFWKGVRVRPNPPRGARARGGARLIYPSGRIRGVWEGRHKNGKLYRHRFGRGLKSVYGLPGGDLLITAHKGRLWKTFF